MEGADEVELRVVRLPLIRPFATAHGTVVARDVLLVRVRGDGLEGWGECAAEATPTYWYETVATARLLAPRLLSGAPVVGHPMAKAAIEMAALDRTLRAAGRSLAAELGGRPGAMVPATATVGFQDDVEELVEAGYRSVKIKVAPRRPLPSVPERVLVQLDANGAFAGAAETALAALDGIGARCIEQPLPPDDLVGHARLRRTLRTPVCLDESITSMGTIDSAAALDACELVCLKPARLGGLGQAVAAHERASAAGLQAKVGGLLETGIGRAAALAFASRPGFSLPPDLSASARYWRQDVTDPFVLSSDGRLTVPDGPGLGVDVDHELVDHATIAREVIRPGRTRS